MPLINIVQDRYDWFANFCNELIAATFAFVFYIIVIMNKFICSPSLFVRGWRNFGIMSGSSSFISDIGKKLTIGRCWFTIERVIAEGMNTDENIGLDATEIIYYLYVLLCFGEFILPSKIVVRSY